MKENFDAGSDLNFEAIREAHISLAKKLIAADGKNMYQMDIMALAVINRSLSISAGISSMIEQGNLLCAASLIRLQIDSSLRFFASTLVEDADNFCKEVFEGKHIRKMKDKCGKSMTDSYLVEKISERFPWVESAYEATSGFIHFSEKHIFSSVNETKSSGSINIRISDVYTEKDSIFRDELKVVLLHSTMLVLQCVGEWVDFKENRGDRKFGALFGSSSG